MHDFKRSHMIALTIYDIHTAIYKYIYVKIYYHVFTVIFFFSANTSSQPQRRETEAELERHLRKMVGGENDRRADFLRRLIIWLREQDSELKRLRMLLFSKFGES